jgi:hypothetical protein
MYSHSGSVLAVRDPTNHLPVSNSIFAASKIKKAAEPYITAVLAIQANLFSLFL